MIEKQKQVHIIQPTIGDRAKEIIRVAAYCRVSTDSEDQANSFIAQVQYYTDYIKSNSQMKLVDIYADDGITGTSIEKREDLLDYISTNEVIDLKFMSLIIKKIIINADGYITIEFVNGKRIKERNIDYEYSSTNSDEDRS